VVVLIFIVMFMVCFFVFWLVAKPTGAEKKAVQRLQAVTRPNKSGNDGDVDVEGILRPAAAKEKRNLAQSRIWLAFLHLLEESNAGQTPKEVLLWSLGCGCGAAAIVMFIMPAPLIVSGLAMLAMTGPILRLKFLRNRRVNKFEAVLPDALDLMSRALRSGHAVSAAIEVVAEQGREPVATEFKALFQQQSYGLPFRDALDAMMKRVPSSDLQFAGTAMLVQKETGGNLAEILDRTVEIMRERVRIRGEVKTKTAQGKLTGLILALLPVVMLLIISFTNPEYAHNLTGTETGHKMLEASGAMIFIGYMFIRKIVNIEV
jgi:tight adherence protein B